MNRKVGQQVERAREGAHRAAREVAPWVERLARLGYVSKGVVYVAVGVLAAQAALGLRGSPTDQQGALSSLARGPFGQVVLTVLALGLLGYALWQLVRAVLDPEGQGHRAKGVAKRIGYALSGVGYLGLAALAANLAGVARTARPGGGGGEDAWVARLMAQPFGEWLVGLVGAVMIGVAAQQIYVAATSKFLKRLRLGGLDAREQEAVRRTGQVGIVARAVVLALVGLFLVQAALAHDPSRAGGLLEALRAFERAPFGPFLLGLVALGLVAYGVYAAVQGRWREIRVE